MRKIPLLIAAVILLSSCAALPAAAPVFSTPETSAAAPAVIQTASVPATSAPLQTLVLTELPVGTATPPPTTIQSASPRPALPSAAPGAKAAPLSLQLPQVLYGVAGREMHLYLDSVTLCSGPYAASTDGPGALDGTHWSWTPEKEGSYTLNVQAGNQSGSVLLQVTPASAGEGVTRACLFIGDSVTGRGAYTRELLKLADPDVLKIKLLGSRGASPNLHEGRPGWKAASFTDNHSASNPFYSPSSKSFSFAFYMKKMGYAGVDRVCIALGLNDVFKIKNDAALKTEVARVMKRYDEMISSIRKYDKKIKIGVFVTIPPTSKPETFKKDYGTKYSLQRYRRNNFLFARALIGHFMGREKENVWLVPVNAAFDTANCSGVHPFGEGYNQIAEEVWGWLKNMETRE